MNATNEKEISIDNNTLSKVSEATSMIIGLCTMDNMFDNKEWITIEEITKQYNFSVPHIPLTQEQVEIIIRQTTEWYYGFRADKSSQTISYEDEVSKNYKIFSIRREGQSRLNRWLEKKK